MLHYLWRGTLEVSGQEILTKDKVSLPINLTATYQLTDVEAAVRSVKDPLDYLDKEVQFGLRGAVGTRTLDALLEDKEVIDNSVADRRREWFERMTDPYTVLWWIARGHRPTLAEAEARLEHLRRHGPSTFAFGLRDAFGPPDAAAPARPALADDRCPAG
jgi:hypothetical protein